MKILIGSQNDNEGGAAIAAYRLHKALLEAGVQSSMLVQKKLTDDYIKKIDEMLKDKEQEVLEV